MEHMTALPREEGTSKQISDEQLKALNEVLIQLGAVRHVAIKTGVARRAITDLEQLKKALNMANAGAALQQPLVIRYPAPAGDERRPLDVRTNDPLTIGTTREQRCSSG